MKLEKFNELYNLPITHEVEKDYKGLPYLSWANAYKLAMEKDPTMTYEVAQADDGMPFFSRGDIHIVKTKVTMFGETKEMFLPIMDNKHNSVSKPNSRQVNDNIMRCLAKNIAMFGIGLPLYVGEDLAQFQDTKAKSKEERGKEEGQAYLNTRQGMIEEIKEYARDEKMEKLLNHYKVKSLEEMTDEQLEQARVVCSAKKKKETEAETDPIKEVFNK